jgi:xanthine dehydrogenase YagS FAD-binding subunit
MRSFEHVNARTIRQACTLLRDHEGRAVLNAGGTDLLSTLKNESLFAYPEVIINIKTIRGLEYVREGESEFRIGALTRLHEIAGSRLLKENCPSLAEAARMVATPQVRNMATIGGNLCQDIRCWYYRYPRALGGPIECLRKGKGPCLAVRGDNRYHAVLEAKKCFAVCPSDTAVALAALGASLAVSGPDGERSIEVGDLFGNMALFLAKDEMITEIRIPKSSESTRQGFLKYTLRKPIDFAVVSVASAITILDGLCTDVRLVLGAVASGPVRVRAAEDFLKGKRINQEMAQEAATLAIAGSRPLSMNGYKIEVAKSLIKKAILTPTNS